MTITPPIAHLEEWNIAWKAEELGCATPGCMTSHFPYSGLQFHPISYKYNKSCSPHKALTRTKWNNGYEWALEALNYEGCSYLLS